MRSLSGACVSFSCFRIQPNKAYLKGLLIAEITKVKRESSSLKDEVESQVHTLEQQYIVDPLDSAKEAWQSAQFAYEHLISAEKRSFFSMLAFFEEGEKTGHLSAMIAHSQQRSPAIEAIRSQAGPLVNFPDMVMQELARLYETLYLPGTSFTVGDLDNYKIYPSPTHGGPE